MVIFTIWIWSRWILLGSWRCFTFHLNDFFSSERTPFYDPTRSPASSEVLRTCSLCWLQLVWFCIDLTWKGLGNWKIDKTYFKLKIKRPLRDFWDCWSFGIIEPFTCETLPPINSLATLSEAICKLLSYLIALKLSHFPPILEQCALMGYSQDICAIFIGVMYVPTSSVRFATTIIIIWAPAVLLRRAWVFGAGIWDHAIWTVNLYGCVWFVEVGSPQRVAGTWVHRNMHQGAVKAR